MHRDWVPVLRAGILGSTYNKNTFFCVNLDCVIGDYCGASDFIGDGFTISSRIKIT